MQDPTPIDHGLVALSSFGFGGANMHMVMQAYSGDRMQLLSSDSSSEDSAPIENVPNDNITPLAARTADGLAYLAKVVNEVSLADTLQAIPCHQVSQNLYCLAIIYCQEQKQSNKTYICPVQFLLNGC